MCRAAQPRLGLPCRPRLSRPRPFQPHTPRQMYHLFPPFSPIPPSPRGKCGGGDQTVWGHITPSAAETLNSNFWETTGDHNGRPRAGYGFGTRETTRGDHKVGDHGGQQRIQDPGNHAPARETTTGVHELATDLGPGRPQGETTKGRPQRGTKRATDSGSRGAPTGPRKVI